MVEGAFMPEYQCFVRSRGGRLLRASVTVCRDDDQARERAAAWLAKDPLIGSIEIWDPHREVAMVERPSDGLPDAVA